MSSCLTHSTSIMSTLFILMVFFFFFEGGVGLIVIFHINHYLEAYFLSY
jgi:hypothetical protein